MKILINDFEVLVNLKNTNFVDYWYSKIFENKTELKIRNNHTVGGSLDIEKWNFHKNELTETLSVLNQIVIDYDIGEEFMYDIKDAGDPQYLEYVHEKWAHTTKLSYEKHLPIYEEEIANKINTLSSTMDKLISKDYTQINPMVHNIEFMYKFLYMKLILDIDIPYGEYTIEPDDTTCEMDNLSLSYWDIGRPQFEKWQLSRNLYSSEISNYMNISNHLELRAERQLRIFPHEYLEDCKEAGIPAWGPYLGIGNIDRSFYSIGHDFYNNLQTTNNIRLSK